MASHLVGKKLECMVFIERKQWEREIFRKERQGLGREQRDLEGRIFLMLKRKIHTMCIFPVFWTHRNF